VPSLDVRRGTDRPSACACSTGEQQPFTLTFPTLRIARPGALVPRRRRRCISACDRVSAEYDRPRETRSKTTDTFPRLRLCRGVPAHNLREIPSLSREMFANAIVYHYAYRYISSKSQKSF